MSRAPSDFPVSMRGPLRLVGELQQLDQREKSEEGTVTLTTTLKVQQGARGGHGEQREP